MRDMGCKVAGARGRAQPGRAFGGSKDGHSEIWGDRRRPGPARSLEEMLGACEDEVAGTLNVFLLFPSVSSGEPEQEELGQRLQHPPAPREQAVRDGEIGLSLQEERRVSVRRPLLALVTRTCCFLGPEAISGPGALCGRGRGRSPRSRGGRSGRERDFFAQCPPAGPTRSQQGSFLG